MPDVRARMGDRWQSQDSLKIPRGGPVPSQEQDNEGQPADHRYCRHCQPGTLFETDLTTTGSLDDRHQDQLYPIYGGPTHSSPSLDATRRRLPAPTNAQTPTAPTRLDSHLNRGYTRDRDHIVSP